MFRDHQKRIRQKVILRDQSLCAFCDRLLSPNEITLDHLVPASQGGAYHSTNLTVACFDCNNERDTAPFLSYLQKLGASSHKMEKFQRLLNNQLRIKVLNLAKENLVNYYEVPQDAIDLACQQLQVEPISFEGNDFAWDAYHRQKDIISHFNHLIHLIERE
jgi:HNH endonuclease